MANIFFTLKSATKPFNVLLACTFHSLLNLQIIRLNYPLQPTASPYSTMRIEAIRSIILISCRGVIQNLSGIHLRKH